MTGWPRRGAAGGHRLWVDEWVHRDELARFRALVVVGPRPADCSVFTGSVTADGYGGFWIRRGGRSMCVRAHRYALAWASPAGLGAGVLALHECDNPLCVKVSPPGEAGPAHVVAGTQRDNMIRMGRRGRGGGRRLVRGDGRAGRRARSVALREAVRGGWNEAAVARALLGADEPTLW